jgi:SpoVK/Ycf46/Vps4 family AAA+-type ATPase
MLQQLESYRGIVACTTNTIEALDRAVLRRFVYKIELRPPTGEQLVALFESMFGTTGDAPALRAQLHALGATPGDLAVVRRRLQHDHRTHTTNEILAELRIELGYRERHTGFRLTDHP